VSPNDSRILGQRYQLDRHIADGGMGAIWTARHLTLGTRVAVKLMTIEGASRPDLRARFEQEAKAVARLRHPNIVEVIDYGTDGDTPYIVMELLDGIDLLATIEQSRSWPLSEIASLVSQAARGLGAAHRAGLIHRDVKPANIFLARSAATGEVVAKVIDFGIAKWAENTDILTGASVVLGSPSYMSPEQIRGHRPDERVDTWALAVVTFLLVTGEMPFVGKNGPDIAKQIVMGNRKPLPATVPNGVALERFFARAFAADPAARFRSVEELAGEFILVAGAPSPLRIAERAEGDAQADLDDQRQTRQLLREDSTTNRIERSPGAPKQAPADRAAEDLEETVTDDPLSPSEGEGDRTRSFE
jgi:serine/threonine protein kinase